MRRCVDRRPHQVALDARHRVTVEYHRELARLRRFGDAPLIYVNVVPALRVKRIGHQRRAEHEAHLASGHARFELVEHILGNNIEHNVELTDLNSNGVTLRFSSDPFDVELALGEAKIVDLDGDGVFDIKVTFNGINDGRADLTYEKLPKSQLSLIYNKIKENKVYVIVGAVLSTVKLTNAFWYTFTPPVRFVILYKYVK